MLDPRSVHQSLLIALAISLCLGTAGPLGVTPEASAQERPACENFLDQEDAQIAFDADPSDPFGLDEQDRGDRTACQQPAGKFGTPPLVNCDDLRDHPAIAQTLYDNSLTKYGSDRYALAACNEQASTGVDAASEDGSEGANGANRGSQENDLEVLDGVPSETGGSGIVVSTAAPGTGETLEARLEARFAMLEAQFAAFELRAANGFDRFSEFAGDTTASGPVTTVDGTTIQQPNVMRQRAGGHDDGANIRAQKAKDGNKETARERKIRRDCQKIKDRHRS